MTEGFYQFTEPHTTNFWGFFVDGAVKTLVDKTGQVASYTGDIDELGLTWDRFIHKADIYRAVIGEHHLSEGSIKTYILTASTELTYSYSFPSGITGEGKSSQFIMEVYYKCLLYREWAQYKFVPYKGKITTFSPVVTDSFLKWLEV